MDKSTDLIAASSPLSSPLLSQPQIDHNDSAVERDGAPCRVEQLECSQTEQGLDEQSPAAPISRSLAASLYTSHFLSTWNSRLFEFGAVLFLASIYPNTLRPMSVYALVRSASAIIFSPAVGSWIDRGNRLSVVRVSIMGQRLAVAASCALFAILTLRPNIGARLNTALFALAVILSCAEKLCAVMNLVAVERDWVVVITEHNESARRILNARMRRIDLFCKLLGPLTVSLVNGGSTIIAIWITLGMNVLSVPIEYICIARVFNMVPRLQRTPTATAAPPIESDTETSPTFSLRVLVKSAASSLRSASMRLIPFESIPMYFKHTAFLPSFSLSLLYLTVLSFSGPMVTFLLSSGYNSFHVGIARSVSTIFELSATWIAPRLSKAVGPVRGGLWSICWEMVWLAGGVGWYLGEYNRSKERMVLTTSGLVGGVALSRVGLWGFDLCAQNIIQDHVDLNSRGSFSSVEASFQNLFELLSYVSTIVFARPDQFEWPSIISLAAVYIAGGLYTAYVRRERGHLVHKPSCIDIKREQS